MRRHLQSVRPLESVLLIVLFWTGLGWILVNRTIIPNEVFVVGSIALALIIVWITRRILSDYGE